MQHSIVVALACGAGSGGGGRYVSATVDDQTMGCNGWIDVRVPERFMCLLYLSGLISCPKEGLGLIESSRSWLSVSHD